MTNISMVMLCACTLVALLGCDAYEKPITTGSITHSSAAQVVPEEQLEDLCEHRALARARGTLGESKEQQRRLDQLCIDPGSPLNKKK